MDREMIFLWESEKRVRASVITNETIKSTKKWYTKGLKWEKEHKLPENFHHKAQSNGTFTILFECIDEIYFFIIKKVYSAIYYVSIKIKF